MFAEMQRGFCLREDFGEPGFTVDELCIGEVFTIEMEKIKDSMF